jgi:hypothetical protein
MIDAVVGRGPKDEGLTETQCLGVLLELQHGDKYALTAIAERMIELLKEERNVDTGGTGK